MANEAPEIPESELCSQLIGAGEKLLAPPSSVDEALGILKTMEELLSSLEQLPSQAVREALVPAMNGLVSDELFKHDNMEVRVSVMSCIHELIRVGAPDTPYIDDCMKVIFRETVTNVFGKLSSFSGRSYDQALQILHTVAQVKSSLILLDLDCNQLINRMFETFIDNIQPNHPDVVFSDMEEIMTLLIQETEDISVEILKPLLTVVNQENQIDSPTSRILAAKVLKNCSEIVKPYLIEFVEQLRKDIEHCTYVIASIWPDMPALENEMNETDKDATDVPLIPEGSTSTQMDNYESSLVNEQTSKALIVHENHEKMPIIAIGSVQDVTTETGGEVLPGGGVKNSMTLADNQHIEQMKFPPKESVEEPDALETKGMGKKTCTEALPVGKANTLQIAGTEQIEQVQILGKESLQSGTSESGKGLKHSVVSGDKSSSENPGKQSNYGKRKSLPGKKGKKKKTGKEDCDAEVLPKGCRKPEDDKEYGEELVDSRILVWWPEDQQFYEGNVTKYDPVKREHQVDYLDGDVEVLTLIKERWLLRVSDEAPTVKRRSKKPRTVKEHRAEIVDSRVKEGVAGQ
ncbi:OLC1v1005914C1 [Oldenlandia corymbosa var. corymbosa]|uniref:OLC1v1005914C1 n=1 Tax=Oldenlandia corymbosa var. corymbosa TaxID=529605 RepID=A0AAV1DHS0_OLDCO|nr:OLC1v1005914C1 [Oldenlandia corymbosa var. corymbosa]